MGPGTYKTAAACDTRHQMELQYNVVPIVVVPGVMGSRLQNRDGQTVWDPDHDIMFMAKKFLLASADKRRQMLIDPRGFSNDYLRPTTDTSNLRVKTGNSPHPRAPGPRIAIGADRFWHEIAYGFYGGLLEFLDKLLGTSNIKDFDTYRAEHSGQFTEGDIALRRKVRFPIYACGYNWTQSNRDSGADLVRRIDQVIKLENAKLPEPKIDKVIVVTHSMGGLVGRAASALCGGEGKIHAVIHGAQPATGSPGFYTRTKAGFENRDNGLIGGLQSRVLGDTGPKVAAITALAPGPMELLPSHLYEAAPGDRRWLRIRRPNGNGLLAAFPNNGDPYTEIYMNKDNFWRLLEPQWLVPWNTKLEQIDTVRESAWQAFCKTINKTVRLFHSDLDRKHHPITYTVHGRATGQGDATYLAWNYVDLRISTTGYRKDPRDIDLVTSPRNRQPDLEVEQDRAELIMAMSMTAAVSVGMPPPYPDMYPFYSLDATAYATQDYLYDRPDKGTQQPLSDGKGKEYWSPRPGIYLCARLQPPDGQGDGIVPYTSGDALHLLGGTVKRLPDVLLDMGEEAIPDVEHGAFYNDETAQRFVLRAVLDITKDLGLAP